MRDDVTKDFLECSGLTILQRKDGYRFSMEAILLADFGLCDGVGGRVLDIGAGSAIISLVVASREPAVVRVTAVEIQERLFELARENVRENELGGRVEVVHADIREFSVGKDGRYDIVFSNPPFGKLNSGRINPDEEKRLARHEFTLQVSSLASSIKRVMKEGGKFFIIYPAIRFLEVAKGFEDSGLRVVRVRPVYSFPGKEAELILIKGMGGNQRNIEIGAPLYIYGEKNEYSEEVKRIYDGKIRK